MKQYKYWNFGHAFDCSYHGECLFSLYCCGSWSPSYHVLLVEMYLCTLFSGGIYLYNCLLLDAALSISFSDVLSTLCFCSPWLSGTRSLQA